VVADGHGLFGCIVVVDFGGSGDLTVFAGSFLPVVVVVGSFFTGAVDLGGSRLTEGAKD